MTKSDLGILGGGQLARMLALDAFPLGIGVSVLTKQSSDPAAQVVGQTLLGSLSDEKDLRKFLGETAALTFESEFVDIPKLSQCLPDSVYVFPNLAAIEAIQDRLTQKRLLDRHEVPTSPWMPVENKNDLNEAIAKFKNGFVLKQRRFGYDGYGTFVVKDGKHDPMVLQKTTHGFIAESFIDFKRELAVSFVRGKKGEFLQLPLVESVQIDSRCFSVTGPVAHPKLGALTRKIKALMEKADYVGILAVELFETPKGLLVNELAPRVHNSAHYSQDGLTCSQFEYHLRAGLGLPLPRIELVKKGFAMVNLLGQGKGQVKLSREPKGHLHWYGKNENREGRKLGHINVIDSTPKKGAHESAAMEKGFSTVKTQVAIIMGSQSDANVMKEAAEVLKTFGVKFEMKIISAHRTVDAMVKYSKEAQGRGLQIIIAGAGGAAHLPGMVASLTTLPVIGVPVAINKLKGLDSLLSIAQMPKGVPVATVAVDNSHNAGLLAVRILASHGDKKLTKLLEKHQKNMSAKVKKSQASLKKFLS